MYANGFGVKKDFKQAAEWYRKAAEQGYADAQAALGVLVHDGRGVKQDYTEAAIWIRKAAEQGNKDAQLYLSGLCSLGQGVIQDCVEAYTWMLLSGKEGKDVKKAKELLQKQMTAEQIAEAQKLAKAFVPKPSYPLSN
jgi:TPR repeat protein